MSLRIPFVTRAPQVAVLHLSGVIGMSGRGALNDRTMGPVIERAFTRGRPAAVALRVNCPGGAPVQTSLMAARIERLASEHGVPVVAFVEDVAASGGYWLACAADEIFADPSSIVGSIGVISAGFGAHEFLARHGLERRVHTAGQSKSMLDPFRPEAAEDVARLEGILGAVHENFKAQVRERRGGRLTGARDLFTGEVWLGREAQQLGLIDGIGHLAPVMKARFGARTRLRHYGLRRSLSARIGLRAAHMMGQQIEERAHFARFGL